MYQFKHLAISNEHYLCITKTVNKIINKYVVGCTYLASIKKHSLLALKNLIIEQLCEDLAALCEKDPAYSNSHQFAIAGHLGFMAVMYYRTAHNLYYFSQFKKNFILKKIAKNISEYAKLKTGIEIHPAARIGKNFVIEHGYGTVIGETCEIGNDCYMLNGVILGARKITNNVAGKRHPTLGNNVQIGAYVRIFGPVQIGDDVAISPNCVITTNIPSKTKVIIINQLQFIRSSQCYPLSISGISYEGNGVIQIYGHGFSREPDISFIDIQHKKVQSLTAKVNFISDRIIRAKLSLLADGAAHLETLKISHLNAINSIQLKFGTCNGEIIVTESAGLEQAVNYLIAAKNCSNKQRYF